MSRSRAIELIVLRFIDDLRCDFHTLRLYVYHCVFACFAIVCIHVLYCWSSILFEYFDSTHPLYFFGRVLGGSYKINSLGSWGISTKAFKIWRGGKCSVAVPPTLHVIFILTATPLFLLVAVAIGLEYNAAHSSVARLLSGLSSVVDSLR